MQDADQGLCTALGGLFLWSGSWIRLIGQSAIVNFF